MRIFVNIFLIFLKFTLEQICVNYEHCCKNEFLFFHVFFVFMMTQKQIKSKSKANQKQITSKSQKKQNERESKSQETEETEGKRKEEGLVVVL